MNIDRMRELADHIEQKEMGPPAVLNDGKLRIDKVDMDAGPDRFNMSDWLYHTRDCGTVGCIAGHAACLFPVANGGHSVYLHAKRALELDEYVASKLFNPLFLLHDFDEITPKQAARVLRLVADGAGVEDSWKLVLDH